ncbi:MAG: hypothetical protein ABI315_14580 [Bacteroidia bacterium]
MLKLAALLFNSLVLLIYQAFFADVITVTQKIPPSTKPDTEFTVEITIVKGSVIGFAKLQQDLPAGFTAVEDETKGAAFTFSNQSVKFIWMSLPSDQEFKIRYKIKVAADVAGDKIIAGKFSYVSDNVKQTVDIEPSTISIGDGKTLAVAKPTTPPPIVADKQLSTIPSVTPTLNEEAQTAKPMVVETGTPVMTETTPTTASVNTDNSPVKCIRKIPSTVSSNFTVELTINKGNMLGFAKLVDVLPDGLTATIGDAKGASFTFVDQKVKFVWVTMPTSSEFKISYNVTALPAANGSRSIDGAFSFIENDETKKIAVPPSRFVVDVATNAMAAVAAKKDTVVSNNMVAAKIIPKKNPEKVIEETIKAETATANTQTLSAKVIPTPQGDINYRIQIAALHRAIEAKKLEDRYHLDQTVNTEMAQGFTKYTVGQHKEYLKARNARELVKSKGVVGPFVTAYNTGKRITVQEALMITSQQWYK